jgi:CubicO group peptidase (beta-lactamase class C family)
VTEDTRFRIGSVTKSFTALAVLQLVEEGRIDLDAPLERYVTGFHLAGEDQPRVTIRHLLSHTSGVGTWTGWRDFADPDDDFAAMVREAGPRTTLVAPPGERFEYANANYVALGAVIEAVTGQRMEDYLTERVFAPLGLDDTSATDDGGLAAGYTSWFGLTVPREVDYPRVLLPTGGITSSATDMLSYLQALSPEDEDGAIVPSGVVDAMHTRSVLLDRPKAGRDLAMSGYGLGWFVEEDGTRWHAGRMPNAASVVAMGPSDDWGFVLLANTDTFVDPPVPALAEGVADVLSGRGIDPMPGPGRYLFVDILAVLCVALCVRSVTRIRSRPARVSGVIGPAVAAVVIVLGVPLAAGLGAELGSPEAVWAVWRALLGAQPDIAVGGIAMAFSWAACAATVAVRSVAVRPEVVACSG